MCWQVVVICRCVCSLKIGGSQGLATGVAGAELRFALLLLFLFLLVTLSMIPGNAWAPVDELVHFPTRAQALPGMRLRVTSKNKNNNNNANRNSAPATPVAKPGEPPILRLQTQRHITTTCQHTVDTPPQPSRY